MPLPSNPAEFRQMFAEIFADPPEVQDIGYIALADISSDFQPLTAAQSEPPPTSARIHQTRALPPIPEIWMPPEEMRGSGIIPIRKLLGDKGYMLVQTPGISTAVRDDPSRRLL